MNARALLQGLQRDAPLIAPSLLSCDFGRLADEVRALEQAGAKLLHLDVMDGHFVPNLSYGPVVCEAVRRVAHLPLDGHLMISDPEKHLDAFVDAGCDSLTVHIEAVPRPRGLLSEIRRRGLLAGVALNPPTPVEKIADCLDLCDQVLVMSVMPGFGGQAFQEVALDKLRALRSQVGREVLLAVDGGVNRETVESAARAGADLLVVGSAIFRSADYGDELSELTRRARIPSSEAHTGS